MGNLQVTKTQFQQNYQIKYVKESEQKVIINKNNNKQYLLKQWSFIQKIQAQKMLQKLKQKIIYPDQYTLSVFNCYIDQYKGLCGNRFKIYAIMQLPQQNLKNQYQLRKINQKLFPQEQLWKIMYQISNAIIFFQKKHLYLQNLNIQDIYLTNDQIYKISDPQLTHLKGDSNNKDYIVRKLGSILIELGLLYKPKNLSSLHGSKLLIHYSSFLTSTINKMINNYITIQGANKYAEENLHKDLDTSTILYNQYKPFHMLDDRSSLASTLPRKKSMLRLVSNQNIRNLKTLQETINKSRLNQINHNKNESQKQNLISKKLVQLNQNSEYFKYFESNKIIPQSKVLKKQQKIYKRQDPFLTQRLDQNHRPKKIISLKKKQSAQLFIQMNKNKKESYAKDLSSRQKKSIQSQQFSKEYRLIKRKKQQISLTKIQEIYNKKQQIIKAIINQEQKSINQQISLQSPVRNNFYTPSNERFQTLQSQTNTKNKHQKSNRTIMQVEQSDWQSEGQPVNKIYQQQQQSKSNLKKLDKSNLENYSYVIQQYTGGSKYQGYKKNGKKCGIGKLSYQDGGMYQGEWKNDLMNGFGKLYYQNGNLAYQGFWKNNQFHGLGKIINDKPSNLSENGFNYKDFSDLNQGWLSYEGQFQDDVKNGKGVLKLSNGQILRGNWINNYVNGQCIFYTISGETINGIWCDNIIVSQH